MRYFLSETAALKWLEIPAVYDVKRDELYEIDDLAFVFLQQCATPEGGAGETDKAFLDYCISEGVLTTEPVIVKRPPLIKSPRPSLRYLELQITDRCNLQCRHCYVGRPGNNELSVDEIKRVLDEFEVMQGLRLLITGGEPLMHRHFKEFNSLLSRYHFRKILLTNGLLLNTDIFDTLNVDEIQFSIDGMEHGHDSLRGKGTYNKVVQKASDALARGLDVSVATMVHSDNLEEFDQMGSFFRRMGVKDWTVDVPLISGNLMDNLILCVPPEIAGKYLNYGFGGGMHGGGETFACGIHLLCVTANGSICKCGFFSRDQIGTLGGGLLGSWKKVRPLKLVDLECAALACNFIEECRGGCRYRASISPENLCGEKFHEVIRGTGKDIYKCYAYGIINRRGEGLDQL